MFNDIFKWIVDNFSSKIIFSEEYDNEDADEIFSGEINENVDS
jgi:hypothetical protein